MKPTLAAAAIDSFQKDYPLREAFLGWQCRVRQHAMRKQQGRPDSGIMPELTLTGETKALGHITTVFNKRPEYSVTPELRHMAKCTHDPAQRRDRALQFLSAVYYQKPHEFSDCLTSSFRPRSPEAEAVHQVGAVNLKFSACAQQYTLYCRAQKLSPDHPLYQATWWHNHLFNPGLSAQAMIIGFKPDWAKSTHDVAPQ